MARHDFDQSARNYLLASSEGEPFVYTDLHMAGYDDGPFGDEEYTGLEYLDLSAMSEFSIAEFIALREEALNSGESFGDKFLRLDFESRDDRFDPNESAGTWSNMLILPTPRDPNGPFTISVYQDFTHVGWLTGPDAEAMAIHLTENFDFGCAIIPSSSIDEDNWGLAFHYFFKEEMPIYVDRSANRILSAERVAPSKLKWTIEPVIVDLPRNVSWDGASLVEATLENESLVEFEGEHDIVRAIFQEILLMADIWTPESKDVFVYVSDEYVGRIKDSDIAAKFHDELVGYEPKLGRVKRGYFYRSPGEPDGFDFDADVRPVIRIDWDEVEA